MKFRVEGDLRASILQFVEKHPSVGPYAFGQLMGEGDFGMIFASSDPEIVLKVVSTEDDDADPRTEIAVMEILQHTNTPFVSHLSSFYTVGSMYVLALRKYDGTLQQRLLQPSVRLDWLVGQLFYVLVSGFYRMHEYGLVHTDVSFENIFYIDSVTPPFTHFYLADFGQTVRYASRPFNEYIDTRRARVPSVESEPYILVRYLDPVHYSLLQTVSRETAIGWMKIWELGLTIFRVMWRLFVKTPRTYSIGAQHLQDDIDELFSRVPFKRFMLVDKNGIQHSIPKLTLKDMMKQMLQYDPRDRISIDKVVNELALLFEQKKYIDQILSV